LHNSGGVAPPPALPPSRQLLYLAVSEWTDDIGGCGEEQSSDFSTLLMQMPEPLSAAFGNSLLKAFSFSLIPSPRLLRKKPVGLL